MAQFVEIEHPDVETTGMCPADAVPVWAKEGWVPVSAEKTTGNPDVQKSALKKYAKELAAADKARKAAADKAKG